MLIYIEMADSQNLLRKIPAGRFGKPEEVADAAMFLVRNEYANNCVLNLDGGLSVT
jgi:3-oxoacyl-[acyl-carrier protein] reductase